MRQHRRPSSAVALLTLLLAGLTVSVAVAQDAAPPPAAPSVPAPPDDPDSLFDGVDSFLIRLKREVAPELIRDDAPSPLELIASALKERATALGLDGLQAVGSQGYLVARLRDTGLLKIAAARRGLEALGFEVLPNIRINTTVIPNDRLWSQIADEMTSISADQAWNVLQGSSAVKVCVVDTGVQFAHPDLAANMPQQLVYDAITDTFADSGNDDTNGHGTHIAGTLAAVGNNGVGVAGVAWRANILGCKFMDGNTGGQISDAIQCLRWCREQGARLTTNSWGATGAATNPAMVREIQASLDAGMLFIAAAGNDATDVDLVPSTPSDVDLPNVIVVGALDNDGNRASFSNYGRNTVDIFAPGVGITSTWPTNAPGSVGYASLSGTSMSAPMVSGTAVLLWTYRPTATYADVKYSILAARDYVPGASESVSGGRLNAFRALQILNTLNPTPPSPGPGPEDSPLRPPLPPAPPPPLACNDGNTNCFAWAQSGFCSPGNTFQGQPVSVVCPVSCKTCGQCNDVYPTCSAWAQQGYCAPGYAINGNSVSGVTCRKSCGTCGSTVAITPQSIPLDISGVWSTNTKVLGRALPIYIKFDVETGSGSATWLANPPQTMSIRSTGENTYTITDALDSTFQVTAVSDGFDFTAASVLTVGTGDKAVDWTRDTTFTPRSAGERLVVKYVAGPNDTLDSIADKFNTTTDALIAANPWTNATLNNGTEPILDGRSLAIPGGDINDGPAKFFDFSTGGGAAPGPSPASPPPAPPARRRRLTAHARASAGASQAARRLHTSPHVHATAGATGARSGLSSALGVLARGIMALGMGLGMMAVAIMLVAGPRAGRV